MFLNLGSLPGTAPGADDDVRTFLRDPLDVLPPEYSAGPQIGVTLPPDAQDSGYSWAGLRLFFSASEPTGIFVVGQADIERWPLGDGNLACR